MRWIKKGLIFDQMGDFDWIVTHASVPFADLIVDDIYRIYFSGRDNLNRSQTGYIEVDIKNPKQVLYFTEKPVSRFGRKGSFDESGAMGSWILSKNGKKYLYYIGWNLGTSVPFRNSVGLAISEDGGRSFTKYSEGPILDRSIHDPFFVASPCVLIDGDLWRMWYLSCIDWKFDSIKPKPYYHIKYAESLDGIDWERRGIVCIDFKTRDEYAISRPSVIKEDGIYKMWYSYRGNSYRIGYAESNDGLQWEREDDEIGMDVSESGWDSEMIEYPFIFRHNENYYMLYNGNDYGKTGIGLSILSKD